MEKLTFSALIRHIFKKNFISNFKLHFCTYETLAFKCRPELEDEKCNGSDLKIKAFYIRFITCKLVHLQLGSPNDK